MLQMENYQGNTNYNLLEDSDIVNNLTSSDTNKALSALQGKNLNNTINSLINVSEYTVTMQNDTKVYLKKFGKMVVGVILATTSYDNNTGTLGTLDEEYRPVREIHIPYIGWSSSSIACYGQYMIVSNGNLSYKTTETVYVERNAIFAYYTAQNRGGYL